MAGMKDSYLVMQDFRDFDVFVYVLLYSLYDT